MENTNSFNVKEASVQEFADKYFVDQTFGRNDPGNGRKEQLNPYSILGAEKVYVRKSIMEAVTIFVDKAIVIKFELFDESRLTRSRLVNTYTYEICEYDDVLMVLDLIDFTVDIKK